MITADQARAELARRELARRELSKRESSNAITPEVVKKPRSLKDRVLDAGGGVMFTAGGGQNPEEVLPMAGQIVGGAIPGVNSFGGSVAGATAGQAMRQGIRAIRGTRDSKPRKLFGVGPTAPGIVNDLAGEAAGTAAGEGIFRSLSKVAEPVANRIMNSVIRPGVDVLKKNPRFGLDALEAGLSGSREGMISQADKIIGQSEDAVGKIIGNSKKRINADRIIKALEDIKANADLGLKPEDVSAVESVKQNFIDKIPIKTVDESRQFVTSVGKKTSPQITSISGSKIHQSIAEPRFDPEAGKYVREIVTPKSFLENPEDIISLHKPGGLKRTLTTISPKTSYSMDALTGPEYKISKEVYDPLGLTLKEGQAMKKAIYSETPDAAFKRSISENPGTTEARRKIASLIRQEIGQAEPSTMPILRKESTAIQARKALMQSLANSQRNVILPKLAGMGAGSLAAVGNPLAAAGVLAGDRGIDLLRSPYFVTGLAKNIMRLKKFGGAVSPAIREMTRRAESN